MTPADFVVAIKTIAAGDALLAPAVTRRLLDRYADRLPPVNDERNAALRDLTEREVEVLKLVGRGLSNREIADRLVLAEPTVKTHVSHVFDKLELRDRAQAVVLAYEAGLIRPGAIDAGMSADAIPRDELTARNRAQRRSRISRPGTDDAERRPAEPDVNANSPVRTTQETHDHDPRLGHLDGRTHQALPRRGGPDRPQPGRPGRFDLRLPRPQRRRQVDHHQDARRADPADQRQRLGRGDPGRPPAPATAAKSATSPRSRGSTTG